MTASNPLFCCTVYVGWRGRISVCVLVLLVILSMLLTWLACQTVIKVLEQTTKGR